MTLIGGLATIPSRDKQLRRVVAAISGRLDTLHLYLSGHSALVPGLPDNVQQHLPDQDRLGDAGKFMGLSEAYARGGYYLTFDDDLDYPPDYIDRLVDGINRHTGKVCSFHGRSFARFPIANYYRSATERHYCLRAVSRDVVVQVPGTGVMGFDTASVALSLEDFPSRNMADVHMAIALRRQGVGAVCLAHAAGWIKHLAIDFDETIYRKHVEDGAEQTDRINNAFASTDSHTDVQQAAALGPASA